MAEERYLALLRRVALGLPLVVGPLVFGGCPWSGDCGDSEPETLVLTAAPDGGAADGGTDCHAACPPSFNGKQLTDCSTRDGGTGWTCNYAYICLGGRRPDALDVAHLRGDPTDARSRWCLELAAAEAASIPAFHALADALLAHGAPPGLVERARAAAGDEARHTRLALRLAGRGELRLRVPRTPTPSLEALARSNAAEGLVREAYAALEAAWQSEHAADAATRAAFAEIARDEAGHALLSHDVAAWLRGRVDARAVEAARVEAIAELRRAFATRERPEGLGLPDEADARALLALAVAA